MSVSSSQASLQAVRQDLDLNANGAMTDRAILNKNIQTSAPIRLADFKGNILGNQLSVNYDEFYYGQTWPMKRYEGSAHAYLTRTGNVLVSGNKILVSAREGGGGGGDRGTEYRVLGRCNESGQYRLTGTSLSRFSSYYSTGQMHVDLVLNDAGYLQGNQSVPVQLRQNLYSGGGERSWTRDVQLNSQTHRFVTLIFRYIQLDGGRGDTFQHDFWDWKLVKL